MGNRKKIIFDCDTGMDDAIAIATICSIRDFEVMGICTVGGNVELHKTTKNTLDVLEFLGRSIKVYKGEEKPLERPLEVAYDYHGESGIGDIVLPKSKNKVEEISAIDFMYETIMENKGEIHLISTGPSTNVAKLMLTYPDVKEYIGSITFMGGGIKKGNVTQYAEFNVYCDPEASSIIINSGVKVCMVGLDATMKAKLYRDEMYFLENIKSKEGLLTRLFYNGMLAVRGNLGLDFAVFHDSIAALSLIREDLFEFQYLNLDVDLSGEKLGRTYIKEDGKLVKVAMNFDKQKFIELMKDIF